MAPSPLDIENSNLECFLRKPTATYPPTTASTSLAYQHWCVKRAFFANIDQAFLMHQTTPFPQATLLQSVNTLDQLLLRHQQPTSSPNPPPTHANDDDDDQDLTPELDHMRRTRFGMHKTAGVVEHLWSSTSTSPSPSTQEIEVHPLTRFSGSTLYHFFTWIQRNAYPKDSEEERESSLACGEDALTLWVQGSQVGSDWARDVRWSKGSLGQRQTQKGLDSENKGEAEMKTSMSTSLSTLWSNLITVLWQVNPWFEMASRK